MVAKALSALGEDELEARSKKIVRKNLEDLTEAHELLWANDTYSVLVVLQAMDAAGKDGTIRHVMSGLNPQGCRVSNFKQPSAEDLAVMGLDPLDPERRGPVARHVFERVLASLEGEALRERLAPLRREAGA